MAETLESRFRVVEGLRMHERVGGDGDPLVLVHGIGVSGRYLVPTAVRLATHRRVLVPDLPGFGRSEPPRRRGVDDLADLLAAWLDVHGLARVPLLGNSFGCQVIVDLAARRPERVERAVLVGPTIDRAARSLPRHVLRLAADMLREPPALWALAGAEYAFFAAKGGTPTVRAMLRDPIERKLPRVAAPTLVVRGELDAIVPRRWAREVVSLLPNGRLVEVPGCAHAVNYHCPDELARLVLEFV